MQLKYFKNEKNGISANWNVSINYFGQFYFLFVGFRFNDNDINEKCRSSQISLCEMHKLFIRIVIFSKMNQCNRSKYETVENGSRVPDYTVAFWWCWCEIWFALNYNCLGWQQLLNQYDISTRAFCRSLPSVACKCRMHSSSFFELKPVIFF